MGEVLLNRVDRWIGGLGHSLPLNSRFVDRCYVVCFLSGCGSLSVRCCVPRAACRRRARRPYEIAPRLHGSDTTRPLARAPPPPPPRSQQRCKIWECWGVRCGAKHSQCRRGESSPGSRNYSCKLLTRLVSSAHRQSPIASILHPVCTHCTAPLHVRPNYTVYTAY